MKNALDYNSKGLTVLSILLVLVMFYTAYYTEILEYLSYAIFISKIFGIVFVMFVFTSITFIIMSFGFLSRIFLGNKIFLEGLSREVAINKSVSYLYMSVGLLGIILLMVLYLRSMFQI